MNLASEITLKELPYSMTNSETDLSLWTQPIPFSYNEWKSILSRWTMKKPLKLPPTSPDVHRQPTSSLKKTDRPSLPRNQVFGETFVDSFLGSPSTHLLQSSLSLNRHDVPKLLATPGRRYVSSFKTVSHTANTNNNNNNGNKGPTRVSYINDSVLILKLSKDQTTTNEQGEPTTVVPVANKYSSLSMASSVSIKSTKTATNTSQTFAYPTRLSPILRVEGQKRRVLHHDASIIAPGSEDLVTFPSPCHPPMSTSTTSHHPQSNSSLFTYRSTAAAAAAASNRSKVLSTDPTGTTSTNIVISNEKYKSTMPSSLRPTRQLLTHTTSMPSNLLTSQQTQRSNPNSKNRHQQDKFLPVRETFEYPDPFTNCPPDILSKLAQLTKLQLETIEWEKKKRFTKRKPLNNTSTNGTTHGKDSP